jgi:hypothetical protein
MTLPIKNKYSFRKLHANHNGDSNYNDTNMININLNDNIDDYDNTIPNANVVNFDDFVRVCARFRPIKKDNEKNLLNKREEKLKCTLSPVNKRVI